MSRPLFATRLPLLLASASPRRKAFLEQLGVEFSTRPCPLEEPSRLPGESPQAYAMRVARVKALHVGERYPGSVVLAADTVVVLAGQILGKPADAADARRMLERLCGKGKDPLEKVREHEVVTGCCVTRPKTQDEPGPSPYLHEFAVTTTVCMAVQPAEALAAYVATGEPMDKAGAYAIQGMGAFLVREVVGSYTNVVGLPLAEVLEVLQSLRVIATNQA